MAQRLALSCLEVSENQQSSHLYIILDIAESKRDDTNQSKILLPDFRNLVYSQSIYDQSLHCHPHVSEASGRIFDLCYIKPGDMEGM